MYKPEEIEKLIERTKWLRKYSEHDRKLIAEILLKVVNKNEKI